MWRERVKYLFLVLCLVRDVSTERGKDVSERGLAPDAAMFRYPLFALLECVSPGRLNGSLLLAMLAYKDVEVEPVSNPMSRLLTRCYKHQEVQ